MFIPGGQGIAAIATVVATASNIGAQVLAKPPPARGSVTQLLISPNAPTPYPMGEGYFAGVLRHDAAYGPTLKDVPNPYRFLAVVYAGGGPIQSISPRVDFATVSSWYSSFLYTSTKLGVQPDTALSPNWTGTPGWGSAYKLSGQAAIGWSLKFDKDGKRFASGVPVLGAYGQWAKVYDPRLDDLQPGGSGPHRLGNEATYEWSANPALHAGTYAFGRYQNGKRVLGVGLPGDGIDWAVVGAWANVVEVNGWDHYFGVVYEPGDRWANLKDICIAGGGEPVAGGKLSFRYSAPTVALDTITAADLTDEAASVTPMQSWRDRINTAIPQYRSPDHNWEIVDGEAVVNSTFLAEDGEEKREAWPFSFVTSEDQASQLAAYRVFDSRELNITLNVKPRLRHYRPGECLALDLPELALDTLAIIRRRTIDPVTMSVTLELISETTAKHAYCLGQTGTAPPTPALSQTPEERDELSAAAARSTYNPRGAYSDAASYAVNDLVFWSIDDGGDGNSYVRIGTGDTSGVDPSDATKWQLFLEGGVPGTPGADALAITISPSKETADYDTNGDYVGGDIEFVAARQNLPGGSAWLWRTVRISDNTILVSGTAAFLAATYPSYFTTTAPENLTISAFGIDADITVHGGFRVEAYTDTSAVFDSVPIVKVQDGAPGAPGEDAIVVKPPSAAWSIAASQNGTVSGGELPRTLELSVTQGATDLSDDTDTDYVLATPVGFTGSMGGTNGKVLTVTALSADSATASVAVSHDGVDVGVVEVSMTKARQGAAAVQFRDDIPGLGQDATYVLTAQVDMNLPASAGLSAEATAIYDAASGQYKPRGKITYQNVTDAGTETDLVVADGTTATFLGDPGQIDLPSTSYSPGHSVAKLYRIKFYSRRAPTGGGTGNPTNVSGDLFARSF